MKQKNGFVVAFILVTSLFFLWAFLHNINPILIPHLKKACQLTDTESALIDSSVYLGYFFVALPAGWVMHRYGYVKGIYLGLALYCIGAFLFIPAAGTRSYAFFLFALFVMAAGATFLETVANPYVTKLGDPSGAAQRLNFAQSFNGVGAFIAPLIGGQFILSGIEHSETQLAAMAPAQLDAYLAAEAASVKMPYLAIGCVVLLILLLFLFVRIPEIKEKESGTPGGGFSFRVLRHKPLRYAIIAEFCSVGAQVCIGSFFIRYSRYVNDIPEKDAAFMWGGIAMVGFMVGRFAGTFIMRYIRPATLLYTFALINVLLLVVALVATSQIAVYAVVATPFFMSIMFPTIFALGIAGLGEETKIASSLLVMSIVGGAFFPLIMGWISDSTGNIQIAYVVPLFCFLVILWFGFTQRKTVIDAAPADPHALHPA